MLAACVHACPEPVEARRRGVFAGMKATIFLLIPLVLLAVGYWLQRGWQVHEWVAREFQPNRYEATPAGQEMLARARAISRAVSWSLADGSVQNAFYVPGRNAALIVYAHGSPGTGASFVPEARALREAGYGSLLVDLPGYGSSEGDRTWGQPFVDSIRAAVDFAVRQPGVDPRRIGVHGYSNGGSVMARAAAEDPRISAVALVAAYTDLSAHFRAAYGQRRLPALHLFALAAACRAGLPIDELDTAKALTELGDRPVLIVAGGRDRQIPVEMSESLQSASSHAEMRLFPAMGHVGFANVLGSDYFQELERFWDEALPVTGRARTDGQPTLEVQ